MRQISTTVENGILMQGFLEDCKLRGLSSTTIENYVSILKVFNIFFSRKAFHDIGKEDIQYFIRYLKEKRRVSHKRVANYLYAISSFYDYLLFKDVVTINPVDVMKKRYLRGYKRRDPPHIRKLISVEEMSTLVNSTLDLRAKAIITLLAKTGIRRGELISIDIDDIDWENQMIILKRKAKRSNRIVFFDNECAIVLKRWLTLREKLKPKTRALFVSRYGKRIDKNVVYNAVTKNAEKTGLHNPKSQKIEDHFSPHCCRHWFTTMLLRNGMPREYVKELRGDARNDVIDIYHHIDIEDLKKSYLACIPVLGIE